MTRNRIVWLGVLSVLATASIVTYLLWPKPEPIGDGDTVRIGYSRLRISLPIFVAQEKGLFKKHGIKAELEMYDTAQPMAQALVEGKIDVAGYTAMPITYSGMIRSGRKLYFTTTMLEDQNHRISYLLRKKPTGPDEKAQITSTADLRGKRIGILPTIAYKAWLEAILKDAGVNPADVTIQQVEPQLQPQLLANGGIDALFSNDPPATTAIAKGIAEFINPYVECPRVMGDPFPFASFNVSKEWGDANPELFRRLVAALDEAIIFINDNPKEANQLMKPYLSEVFRPHVDQYPDARYLNSWDSPQRLYVSLADEYQRMGIIPGPIDLSGLVYQGSRPQGIPAAK